MVSETRTLRFSVWTQLRLTTAVRVREMFRKE
jgi:hypothetical protein